MFLTAAVFLAVGALCGCVFRFSAFLLILIGATLILTGIGIGSAIAAFVALQVGYALGIAGRAFGICILELNGIGVLLARFLILL